MQFKNFKIWRGRLPHWRADDVRYYVTFRHRRPLDDAERRALMKHLIKPEGKRWDLMIACVLPENTELIFTMLEDTKGRAYELSDIVEAAKRRAGKLIIHNTGEKYPPFYTESFDRIIRDEPELEEHWERIFNSPVNSELCEEPEEYEALWVANT